MEIIDFLPTYELIQDPKMMKHDLLLVWNTLMPKNFRLTCLFDFKSLKNARIFTFFVNFDGFWDAQN